MNKNQLRISSKISNLVQSIIKTVDQNLNNL